MGKWQRFKAWWALLFYLVAALIMFGGMVLVLHVRDRLSEEDKDEHGWLGDLVATFFKTGEELHERQKAKHHTD